MCDTLHQKLGHTNGYIQPSNLSSALVNELVFEKTIPLSKIENKMFLFIAVVMDP